MMSGSPGGPLYQEPALVNASRTLFGWNSAQKTPVSKNKGFMPQGSYSPERKRVLVIKSKDGKETPMKTRIENHIQKVKNKQFFQGQPAPSLLPKASSDANEAILSYGNYQKVQTPSKISQFHTQFMNQSLESRQSHPSQSDIYQGAAMSNRLNPIFTQIQPLYLQAQQKSTGRENPMNHKPPTPMGIVAHHSPSLSHTTGMPSVIKTPANLASLQKQKIRKSIEGQNKTPSHPGSPQPPNQVKLKIESEPSILEKNHLFINQFLNNIKARTEKYMQNFNNGGSLFNQSVEETQNMSNESPLKLTQDASIQDVSTFNLLPRQNTPAFKDQKAATSGRPTLNYFKAETPDSGQNIHRPNTMGEARKSLSVNKIESLKSSVIHIPSPQIQSPAQRNGTQAKTQMNFYPQPPQGQTRAQSEISSTQWAPLGALATNAFQNFSLLPPAYTSPNQPHLRATDAFQVRKSSQSNTQLELSQKGSQKGNTIQNQTLKKAYAQLQNSKGYHSHEMGQSCNSLCDQQQPAVIIQQMQLKAQTPFINNNGELLPPKGGKRMGKRRRFKQKMAQQKGLDVFENIEQNSFENKTNSSTQGLMYGSTMANFYEKQNRRTSPWNVDHSYKNNPYKQQPNSDIQSCL
ncbi:hypothetical protein FGO68_gene5873 [Halteria grandinella]|uniref:Uncharacterized protein n=1 Tax=Halteria grandinella TaxID=5974 RepID=A0A8J8NWW6_HALGN|nr:hypothetical protein FGO68_gene5873 [Halteria grandinella]